MKHDVLKSLVSDLRPFRPMDQLRPFLLKRLLPIFVVYGALALIMVRYNETLATRWDEGSFHLQNVLWAFTALGSFVAFYYSSFPQRRYRLADFLAIASVFTLFGLELGGVHRSGIESEFQLELNIWRGGCGIVISLLSIGYWWMLQRWAGQAASRSPATTGFWASMSASAAGCLLMQAVCWQEGSLHMLLWHFLPLIAACYFGPLLARRWMQW